MRSPALLWFMISNVHLPEAANCPCYLVLFLLRLLWVALIVTTTDDE